MDRIPKLRFPEFSGEWEEKEFGQVYSFRSTNSLSRDKLNYEQGEVKNIHYGDIHTKFRTLFDIENENVPFINSEVSLEKIPEENYCQNGDLIIADASEDYADIGKSIEIINTENKKLLAGLHTFLARPEFYKVAIGFGGYIMKSPTMHLQIKTIAQGTKVLSISTKRLAEISLNIPTLPEQEEIASFLSSVDSKIEKLERKKELWEQYKKGMMQKIFSQELRFKDENGEDYPEWEEKSLGEILSAQSSGISNNTLEENEGEYPIYGATGLIKNIDFYEMDEDYIAIVKDGAGAGRTLYCLGQSSILATLQYLLLKGNNNLKFCYYLLSTLDFTKYLVGSTIPHIYFKDYSLEKFKIPSLPEQTQIADFLSSIDSKIEIVGKELDGMKEFKKGLLQQIFV